MSDKVRVFEIAEEAASTSAEVMQKAKELGWLLTESEFCRHGWLVVGVRPEVSLPLVIFSQGRYSGAMSFSILVMMSVRPIFANCCLIKSMSFSNPLRAFSLLRGLNGFRMILYTLL